jgi:hypothetical protein
MTDPRALTPDKRALLAQALRRRRAAAAAAAESAIPRLANRSAVPLSSAQRRMWFFQQWEPESPTFNAARALRLRGPLDVAALRRSLQSLVERHLTLRTVVRPGPEPHQVVLESWSLPFAVLDRPGAGEKELHTLLRELAREPFDLTADLMLRATLIRLGGEDHVLLLRLHHIAGDAHSDGILFGDLSELYAAHRDGREPQLPEVTLQYADYAAWQNTRLQGPVLDELVAYWRAQLDGAPALLALPLDRPRPPVQRHEGAHRRFSLDRALGDRLTEFSRGEKATFFMGALAVFVTLLYRRSGADDIVIGSPIANRNRVELQPIVGFFSNTIVLRTRLGGNPSFSEVLGRVRETALGAYAHQDMPFEKIVETVAPRRDPSYNPIFQVNFRAQAVERRTLTLAGLETEAIPVDIGFSRFDFALELELRSDALTGYFEYDLDLFEPATVEGFTNDLAMLTEKLLDDPDAPVLSIKLPDRAAVGGARIARRRRGAQP